MKKIQIILGLAVALLASSCRGIVPPTKDIHASPVSVIRAMFEGYKNNNTDLIISSAAPARRQNRREQMPKDPLAEANKWLKEKWGVPLSDVDIGKITLKINKDQGDKKYVDAQYNGKSCGDQATVIRINGKWYIDWF